MGRVAPIMILKTKRLRMCWSYKNEMFSLFIFATKHFLELLSQQI